MAITTFAAIDVGSNEVSMKIFEVAKKIGIRELTNVRHHIEIGAETFSNGRISNAGIEELCKILHGFREIMKEYNATEYCAYATSALREAMNQIVIQDRIKLRDELKVKVLSNSEQRFLCYKAIALKEPDFDRLIAKGAAIVDVGAGSTQISIFEHGRLNITQNMRVGSLRIKELLGYLENRAENYKQLISEYIECDITSFYRSTLHEHNVKSIVAVGDQLQEFVNYVRLTHSGNILRAEEFHSIYHKLSSQSVAELSQLLHIHPDLAALLLPTATIYQRMFEWSGAESIWLCGIQLTDGIVAEYAEKKEKIIPSHNFTEDIITSARCLSERYGSDTNHIQNVESLALRIFDSLKRQHGLGKRERLFLQIAVMLHDCGSFVNMNEVRENSYKITMSTEIIGLSHYEREIVANMVRYTGSSFPDYEDLMDTFDRDSYIKIAKLMAILRLANAMDKSGQQKVRSIAISLKDDKMTITADTTKDATLEESTFSQNAPFFEQVYGIHPIFKQKRRITYGKSKKL